MEKNLLVELGKRLKALRVSKGMKQKEMAELMGITERNYQRYEYGKVNVPATTLAFFADYFGVSADYLLGRSEVCGAAPPQIEIVRQSRTPSIPHS